MNNGAGGNGEGGEVINPMPNYDRLPNHEENNGRGNRGQ